MFDGVGPVSAAFPPEGEGCTGGLQGGRTHGAEGIIFELMGDARWAPFRQYNVPSKDFGKDHLGCAGATVRAPPAPRPCRGDDHSARAPARNSSRGGVL